jgi:hypothetical protein
MALAAFVAGVLLPASFAVHEPDDVDAAWGAAGLVAGHPVTQVEPVLPPVDEEHCAICHWMRALTHSVTGAPAAGPEIAVVLLAATPPLPSVQFDVSPPSPARAPPARVS